MCPTGFICINHMNAFGIIIVFIIIIYVINKENYNKLFSKIINLEKDHHHQIIENERENNHQQQEIESKKQMLENQEQLMYNQHSRRVLETNDW